MSSETENKSYYTLITGASSGIGKAFAYECAKEKRNLVLVSLPYTGLGKVAEDIINKYGVNVTTIPIDLVNKEAPKKVYEIVKKDEIHINFLINNAGIGYAGRIDEYTTEQIDTMIYLNMRATTVLINLFIEDLKKCNKSYILNMGSVGSYVPVPYKSIYLASKSYIYYLSKALRIELNEYSIQVSAVLPGGVLTNPIIQERIRKAGTLSKVSAMTPEQVAQHSLKKLYKGRPIIVTGRMTRWMHRLLNITPEFFWAKSLKRAFKNSE